MRQRQRLLAVWMVVALVAVLVILAPGVASATDYCGSNGDHGIWLRQGQYVGYGSQGQLTKVNHSLVNCRGTGRTTGSWNTYGVIFADGTDFVEIGVMKYLYCTIGCSTSYKVFGEYGVYPNVLGPYFYSNSTADGGAVSFKANNVSGSFDWKIWWDPAGGSNYELVDTYNLCCQYGYAYGEAARTGKTGTDIIDHHWNMKFKNSNGNWQSINSLVCYADTDADYEWQRVSSTEFRVRSGSGYC